MIWARASDHPMARGQERRPSTSLGGRRDERSKADLVDPAMDALDEKPLRIRSKNQQLMTERQPAVEAPRGRGGVDTSTSQIAALMASAESRLQEQLLIACEKGNRHAAYLLLHQGIDRDRCRGMVRTHCCSSGCETQLMTLCFLNLILARVHAIAPCRHAWPSRRSPVAAGVWLAGGYPERHERVRAASRLLQRPSRDR